MRLIVLCLVSGAIGAVNGFLTTYGILHFTGMSPLAFALSTAWVLFISIVLGTGVARLFGLIWPAWTS